MSCQCRVERLLPLGRAITKATVTGPRTTTLISLPRLSRHTRKRLLGTSLSPEATIAIARTLREQAAMATPLPGAKSARVLAQSRPLTELITATPRADKSLVRAA